MIYRRSILLIHKNFQLRFSSYVCSWIILLSIVYPYLISNLFDYFLAHLVMDPRGPILSRIEQTRKEFIFLLILMEVLLVGLTFLVSLFISHRIAGPLDRLKKLFKAGKKGHFGQRL